MRRASEWLELTCRQRKVPQEALERLVICLNEVLANVMAHGGSTALSAPIRLRLEISLDQGGSKASVTAEDAGTAFNPLSVARKILPKTLGEATPGGLGLVMIRHCSDWLDYRYTDGHNQLTFGTHWTVP